MAAEVISFKLSYQEKLKIIERFSVRIAQSIVGGKVTLPNDPRGDLVHEDGTYSEVKGAGLSSGAIIRRKQLLGHCADDSTKNYVLVFRENRVWKDGRWVYMTLRKARTKKALEDFLFESVSEVCVVHKDAIRTLYRQLRRLKREKRHNFQTGPKVYLKIRPSDLWRLVLAGYPRRADSELVIIGSYKVDLSVINIPAKDISI